MLRTNIQFSSVDQPVKSILVTSAGPVEGKSVTAANLAVIMAQAGLRTILIDADLRRPVEHRLFNLTNEVGLTNALIAQGPLDSYVRPTQVENLRILTTGALPPNPAEALGSGRMRALKAHLESEADMLIFDSPPCFPLTDAAVLARLVDGVVLVVDCADTRRDSALRAKELLEKVGGHILGIVLNRVSPQGSGYYNYYYYYSHDGKSDRKRKSHSPASASILPQAAKAPIRR